MKIFIIILSVISCISGALLLDLTSNLTNSGVALILLGTMGFAYCAIKHVENFCTGGKK